MNQILVTGEERLDRDKKIKEQYEGYMDKQLRDKQQRDSRVKDYTGEKSAAQTKKFVLLFSIFILILGVGLISWGIYTRNKINAAVEANRKPEVEFNYDEANSTVDIAVSHTRGIKEVSYKINNGEEHTTNGNNQKNVNVTAQLEGGENSLVVTILEENGQSVKYSKNYTVEIIPEIKLEAVDNAIKITAKSKNILDNITYKWDDGEETKVEINNESYEGTIAVKRGTHKLSVTATDKNGANKNIEKTVTGVSEPQFQIRIGMKERKLYYLIDITSEVNIVNVKITVNGKEEENTTINSNKYNRENIGITEGMNYITIEIQESDGTTTKKNYTLNTEEIDESDIVYE